MKHIIKVEVLENLPETRPLIAMDKYKNLFQEGKKKEPVGPANNEIWYTTTDSNKYDLSGIIRTLVATGATYNGPAVVSNEYDEEKQMWRMTFAVDVTILGDLNTGTMTAEGPFFITNQKYGLVCNVETIILPKTITRIGRAAFSGCSSLASITIPNSVTSIGDDAFDGCSSLTSINVDSNNPNYSSVDGVLFNKDKTTLVAYPGGKQGAYTIPNSVTSIGEYAFEGCRSLTSVTIPNSVTSIGDYAFSDCSSLTSVTIGNSVTSIEYRAFALCESLTSITIPNSVTSIGDEAFYGCESLTSVTIPNSVTSIGNNAFGYCSSLTSVTIGNSVTSIVGYAFLDCISLTSITCEALTPPKLENAGAFINTNNCPIYVPAESVNTYKTAENWSTYAGRIQAIQ